MPKPPLTEKQKEYFARELNNIISEAPTELRVKWSNEPHIYWVLDEPRYQRGITDRLPEKLYDRFFLLNLKRKNCTLPESTSSSK